LISDRYSLAIEVALAALESGADKINHTRLSFVFVYELGELFEKEGPLYEFVLEELAEKAGPEKALLIIS
jgi:hypothetical protein